MAKAQQEVPAGMQRVYRRFERWRSSHRGRLPIPAGLWASAAEVAREHGVFQTAKVFRLEYAKLKRMASAPRNVRAAATPATFLGSERESDETATFTQLSSPAELRGTRRWSPPSAWPWMNDTEVAGLSEMRREQGCD